MNNDIEPVTDNKSNDDHNIILWIIENQDMISECNMLKNQIQVVSYIKNMEFNNDFVIQCLTWLKSTVKNLCNDHKLSPKVHKTITYNSNHNGKDNNSLSIARSSYFFCKYGANCSSKKKCKNHHFVYDILYADISALLSYIQSYSSLSQHEITKSFNTINYVLCHMFNELS